MSIVDSLEEGDLVYAAMPLHNDGGLEEMPEDAFLVAEGTRGVIIRKGYLEENEDRNVFLVRFEDGTGNLGDPIGCYAEELRVELQ